MKFRPGGDSGRLNWIHSAVESTDVSPPYSLVTGGESIHWIDLSTVFSIFERVLRPGGVVAMIGRRWGTGTDEEMDLIKRSSIYRNYRPRNTFSELESEGLLRRLDGEIFGPSIWRPTIAEYIQARHSQAGLSQEWMGEAMVDEFDVEMEAMLTRMFPGGAL